MGHGSETVGQVLLVVNFENNTLIQRKQWQLGPETDSVFSSVKRVLKVYHTQKAMGMNGPLAL